MSQEMSHVNGSEPLNSSGNSASGGGGTSESGRGPRSKKRQGQGQKKTYSLLDMFHMHQESMGNWADAANETPPPSQLLPAGNNRQRSPSEDRVLSPEILGMGSAFRTSKAHELATHSRDATHAMLPEHEPFECKVANINYKSTDEDLFYFFGGEQSVLNVRSDDALPGRRGVAIVSFKTQDALANALSLDSMELLGRPLRISLYDPYQQHFRPNHGGHRRGNTAYHQHAGGYNTLPHPRRPPHNTLQHSYNIGPPSYRNRDNRKFNYDDRFALQFSKGSNQFYNRYSNRSFDNYGMLQRSVHNENHSGQSYDYGHDDGRRGNGRMRTESAKSNVSNPSDAVERQERRKLQLEPRTKPIDNAEDLPARPASIFGQAKPVNTYEKERQVEERLRMEEEAFKAANRQRSRKSSNDATTAQMPLVHGLVTIMKASHNEVEEREENGASVEKDILYANVNVEDPATVSMSKAVSSLDNNTYARGNSCVEKNNTTASSKTMTKNLDEDHTAATLPRTRNTYNRTFTRSRDSYRAQSANNKQNNQGRRGKARASRGGTTNSGFNQVFTKTSETETPVPLVDKRSAAGKGKIKCMQSIKNVEQWSDNVNRGRNRANELGEKKKNEPNITSSSEPEPQPKPQPSQSHSSKKEKKKQVKEMPKVEAKHFTFSSENKFAALRETND